MATVFTSAPGLPQSTTEPPRERGTRERGRPRGRGRGRGTSRGRGAGRDWATTRPHVRDPTEGWRISNIASESLMMEEDFVSEAVEERARMFCSSAVERLQVERTARQLPSSRAGHVVLFMDELLRTCQSWLNEDISLHRKERAKIKLHEMYRFVSVFLLSHCTGFSFEKTIHLLKTDGRRLPSLELVRFICNNILAFSPTGRGGDGGTTWFAQKDQTQHLTQFEKTAFRQTCKIFMSPTYTLATLDDDLYGTRAADNQVKSLSSRKAESDGHAADAIADALFRITLMVRFRRRGVSQTKNVSSLVEALLDGRGEQSVHGFILTADRGYGKASLMRELLRHKIGSIMIMPDHILQCHPFLGQSYLNVMRYDEDVSGEESEPDHSSEEDQEVQEQAMEDVPSDDAVALVNSRLGRPKAFIINYDPDEGKRSFWAVKTFRVKQNRSDTSANRFKVSAVAVREKGTDKFCRIIRFMYSVPGNMSRSLETWIAVPKGEALRSKLFAARGPDGRILIAPLDSESFNYDIERRVRRNCTVLTVERRCADWFVLRQFRITGTSAGKILCSNVQVRSLVGMTTQTTQTEQTLQQRLQFFSETWFSSSRSTEAMMRGTANEPAVIASLHSKDFIKCLYECGMLGRKDEDWLACSLDGLALIDLSVIFPTGIQNEGTETQLCLASVEIKTSIAPSSLDRALQRSTADVVTCEVGDSSFNYYVPDEHVGQVLLHMVVLKVNHVVYVSACEAGIMYTALVHCNDYILEACHTALVATAFTVVEWAHVEDPEVPVFSDAKTSRLLKSRLKFRKLVNNYVKTKDAFLPLKLFKHAAQSLYSRTKGGVDGSAQARAILRSSTSSLKWEQKLVTQTLKTLAINAFISWRMEQRKAALGSREAFKGLKKYRHSLNNLESLADFIYEVAIELLDYAQDLETKSTAGRGNIEDLSDTEVARLCNLAVKRKRKRLLFFNGTDGCQLRLAVRDHNIRQQRDQQYCALCGIRGIIGNAPGWRGHRTTYKCVQCDVYLCTRIYTGLRKSCSELWHSAFTLCPRSTLRPVRVSAPNEQQDARSSAERNAVGSTRRRAQQGEVDATTRLLQRRRTTT